MDPALLFDQLRLECSSVPFWKWGTLQWLSRFSYYNALYVVLPLKTSQKLELVQNELVPVQLQAGVTWRNQPVYATSTGALFKCWSYILKFCMFRDQGTQWTTFSSKILPGHWDHWKRGLLWLPPHGEARLANTRKRTFSVVGPSSPRGWLPGSFPAFYDYMKRQVKSKQFRWAFNVFLS